MDEKVKSDNKFVNLEFSTKEDAIKYAKKNDINYEIIEPKNRKIIKKSYTDNFIK